MFLVALFRNTAHLNSHTHFACLIHAVCVTLQPSGSTGISFSNHIVYWGYRLNGPNTIAATAPCVFQKEKRDSETNLSCDGPL